MKKITKSQVIQALLLVFFYTSAEAQQRFRSALQSNAHRNMHQVSQPATGNEPAPGISGAKGAALTSCTDKINYVGYSAPYYVIMGGPGNAITALYQVFSNYTGSVISVEFDAAKSPTIAGNPVVNIRLFGISGGSPLTNTFLSPSMPVTITSTAVTSYVVTFASPITVTNGFAVGIINSVSNSRPEIQLGPLLTGATVDYSWVSDVYNAPSVYPVSSYFNMPSPNHVLVRPIVTTSVNASWSSVKTSTGCTLPSIYHFTKTGPAPPAYVNNPMICPGGITSEVDYGDGNISTAPFTSAMHSYTNMGNYIASYTARYMGWFTNCEATVTTNIVADNPVPAFTYTTSGLTVYFTNTSTGLNNFLWNFGDVTTSTLQHPGTHVYDSPGTYVVELEGTAPCGKVRYSISIVVTPVGAEENKNSDKQVSVYPNPAKNSLAITGWTGSDSRIEIYNGLGVLIKTVTNPEVINGKTEMDVSSLPAGIYFIKLSATDRLLVKSFVRE